MTVKATVLFQDNRSGWSETYYAADPTTRTLGQVSDELVNARVKILGAGAKVTGVRIALIETPKKVQVFEYDRDGIAGYTDGKTAVTALADQAHVAVLMPYRTERGTKRYVTLSGFPDSFIQRGSAGGAIRLDSRAIAPLNAFYDFLLSAPWAFKIRERKIDGVNAPTAVTGIATHTNGQYVVTSTLAGSLAAGNKVVLSKVKGNNLVNSKGVRKVTQVLTGTTFTIDRGPRQDLGDVAYQLGGFASKVDYVYNVALNTQEPYVITTRKRGRPFSQRRGRRSASR